MYTGHDITVPGLGKFSLRRDVGVPGRGVETLLIEYLGTVN